MRVSVCARACVGQVLKHKTADGQRDLQEWAECYKRAMNDLYFPYFYVHQNCRHE